MTADQADSAARNAQARLAFDPAVRRQSVRRGRERGCWVYIPAAHLIDAGLSPADPPPFYKTWPGQSSARVRFYRER